MTVKTALIEFVRDESAQDLVEYALLGVFIGVVSIVVWQNIVVSLGLRYTEYNTNIPMYWEPPDPGAGS